MYICIWARRGVKDPSNFGDLKWWHTLHTLRARPDDEHMNDGGAPTQGATIATNATFNIGPPEGISPSFSLSQPL